MMFCFFFFFFNDTATTEIYTLSLHDALPISLRHGKEHPDVGARFDVSADVVARSEEHTSELQSRFDLVCRRLLEKTKHVQLCAFGEGIQTYKITLMSSGAVN